MKALKKLAAITAFSLPLFSGLTGCRDMLHDMNEIAADITGFESISMVDIRDVSNGNTTDLTPFRINRYETTYLLWYEVYVWGQKNGFRFIKNGEEGKTGSSGKPGVNSYLPVTALHPADIFTWCNALSIKNGLTPVYYTDSDCKKILIDSTDIANEKYKSQYDIPHSTTTGTVKVKYDFSIVKNIYQKTNANGYRLPTTPEWQYAAQGARRTSRDRSYNYSGSNNLTEVASTKTMKIPGSFKPNGIGTYDMSGNVCEYTIEPDFSSDKSYITIQDSRIHAYGGHCLDGNKEICSVQKLYDLKNIITLYTYLFGFRLVQNL